MRQAWWYYLPHALVAAGALYLLYLLRLVLAPFLVAYLLAAFLDPLVVRLERRGWRRGMAVASIFALFLLLLAVVLVAVVPIAVGQITEFARGIPGYVNQAPELLDRLRTRYGGIEIPDYLRNAATAHAGQVANVLVAQVVAILGSVGFLLSLIVIPIATFYILNDLEHIRARIIAPVPAAHRHVAQAVARDVAAVFVSYLRGLIIVSLLFGAYLMVALAVVGVPNSVALGLMASVLYPVPYVGMSIAAVVILVVGAVTVGWKAGVVGCLVVFAGNLIFDQLVTPRVVGKSVGLHPVVSMMALLVGASLFGLVGMVAAVPIAGAIQVAAARMLPWLRGLREGTATAEGAAEVGRAEVPPEKKAP